MRQAWLITFVTLAATTVGCGGPPGKAEVSGTVTWDGEPIPRGHITLYLPELVPAGGGPIENGKFHFWSKPGTVQVQILADREGAFDPVEKIRVREQYIPPQYNKASTLSADIELGHLNTLEYPLTSPATAGR